MDNDKIMKNNKSFLKRMLSLLLSLLMIVTVIPLGNYIEAQAAAAHHTEAQEDHHTEVLVVRLIEVLEVALHTEVLEADRLTEALEEAADEALEEAHDAEEAEDKPNAFKITILYKQTKIFNHGNYFQYI